MIPSWGGPPFGPIVFFVAIELGYGLVCTALFWTLLLDRPHLQVRRRAAIGALCLTLGLGFAGDLLPFRGDQGQRCSPALPTYGVRTDALANPLDDTADACETTGQLLVMFGWMSLLGVVFTAGIWRWSDDS